jgi:hypothetical protein
VREDREHRAARGALEAPDYDPTQTDAHIMRVARQASASATGRLMGELKAQGKEEGEDAFDKRFAVAKEPKVGRFIVEVNDNSTVLSCPCSCCGQCVPTDQQVSSADETQWGRPIEIARRS